MPFKEQHILTKINGISYPTSIAIFAHRNSFAASKYYYEKDFSVCCNNLDEHYLFAQTKWTVDPVHSNVKFTITHLVISEVEGSFKKFEGSLVSSKPDFTDAAINFSVDVSSVNTDNDMRDKHLKSDDFFNAEQYPNMSFKSTSIKKLSGNKYELYGNLTIRNVTKPVKFDVTYGGTTKDGYGNTKAGFKATTTINRFDYNLKWNGLTSAGDATVSKDVTIDLRLEFAQAKA